MWGKKQYLKHLAVTSVSETAAQREFEERSQELLIKTERKVLEGSRLISICCLAIISY